MNLEEYSNKYEKMVNAIINGMDRENWIYKDQFNSFVKDVIANLQRIEELEAENKELRTIYDNEEVGWWESNQDQRFLKYRKMRLNCEQLEAELEKIQNRILKYFPKHLTYVDSVQALDIIVEYETNRRNQ